MKRLIIIIAVCIFPVNIIKGIDYDTKQECRRLNNEYDSIYIKYERKGIIINSDSKNINVIWLMVRNNTTCDIKLLSKGNYYRNIDGRVVNYIDNGEEIRLYYEIKRGRKKKPIYSGLLHTFVLKPDNTFVFYVPQEYFKEKCEIIVPFRYSWEEKAIYIGDGGAVKCEIIYNGADIPKGRAN